MSFMNSRLVRVYLIPGLIFQSVIIAGGYGTGREIVEYFTSYGPVGGLLGMLVAFIFFAVVITATFEFARLYKTYDYRSFFKNLLGPVGYVLYEILYVLIMLLVMAIVGSAAGKILQDFFGIPYLIGTSGMIILVGVLNFYGREIVTKTLAYWSYVLYAMFAVFFIACIAKFGTVISANLAQGEALSGWFIGGAKFSFYNLSVVPAILFANRYIETRREAIGAGIVAPVIMIIPGLILHLTMTGGYPQVVAQELPIYWMFSQLGSTILLSFYIIVLFGTMIETGAAFIQGIIERTDAYLEEVKRDPLTKLTRGVMGAGFVIIAIILARFGIINLIAKGYGTMAWGFFIVYVIPVITLGIYKIVQFKGQKSSSVS